MLRFCIDALNSQIKWKSRAPMLFFYQTYNSFIPNKNMFLQQWPPESFVWMLLALCSCVHHETPLNHAKKFSICFAYKPYIQSRYLTPVNPVPCSLLMQWFPILLVKSGGRNFYQYWPRLVFILYGFQYTRCSYLKIRVLPSITENLTWITADGRPCAAVLLSLHTILNYYEIIQSTTAFQIWFSLKTLR